MHEFNTFMADCQVAWRRRQQDLPEAAGRQNGKQRPWILPARDWEMGLWPGIRSGSPHSLPAYLKRYHIQKHQGAHNLKSSWILCANLYFPFGQTEEGRSLLTGFLRERVSPAIESVEGVELEYAEPPESPLHPAALLGEPGGRRGAGQTSPDLAFLVNGRRGLILVENKLVEHSFYPCSGRRRKTDRRPSGNPDPSRCEDPLAVLDDPADLCHQVTWGRRYWDHLAPVIDRAKMASLRCCPAARAGYQLFRQQALAEGIAASGAYDLVASVVAIDERNETLQRSLRSTGIADLEAWGDLFQGRATFKVLSHQQWTAWVRDHNGEGRWGDWLRYVEARYGYGVR